MLSQAGRGGAAEDARGAAAARRVRARHHRPAEGERHDPQPHPAPAVPPAAARHAGRARALGRRRRRARAVATTPSTPPLAPGRRLGARHAVGARADGHRRAATSATCSTLDEFVEALIDHDAGPGAHRDGARRQRRARPAHAHRGAGPPPAQRLPVADGARARAAPVRTSVDEVAAQVAAARRGGARAGDRDASATALVEHAPRARPAGPGRGRPGAAHPRRRRRPSSARSRRGSTGSSRRSKAGGGAAAARPAAAEPGTRRSRHRAGGARRAGASDRRIAAPPRQLPRRRRPAAGASRRPPPTRRPRRRRAIGATSASRCPTRGSRPSRPALKPIVRALYSAGSFVGHDGDDVAVQRAQRGPRRASATSTAPTSRRRCRRRSVADHRSSSASGAATTRPSAPTPAPVAERTSPAATARRRPTASASRPVAADDEPIDLDELTDAPPEAVLTPIDRLAEAFPGSELVAERRRLIDGAHHGERLHPTRPGADRRARSAARHRPEVGPADRLPPAEDPRRRRQPAGRTRSATPRRRCASATAASTSPTRRCARSAPTTGATARVLCVVEESRDIVAIERTGEFRGRYHVLLGAMSPLEGIGPEQLKIRELLDPPRPGGHRGGDRVHQPQHRGRGDGDVPRPAAQAARPPASPGSPAGCRSAATSSTPTSSRSAGPSKAAGSSRVDPAHGPSNRQRPQ